MSTGTATNRKFCTLQEAAERLALTEEQIEMLLRKGILHEFRDGPHRLLRTAEVGAIVAARDRRLERQGRPSMHSRTDTSVPPQADGSMSGPPQGIRFPRSSAPASEMPARDAAYPRTAHRPRAGRNLGSRSPARKSATARSPNVRSSSRGSHAPGRRAKRNAMPLRPSLSVREWFWSGLIQDRPAAIALLAGLVLLGFAAVVAGVCSLAETLR